MKYINLLHEVVRAEWVDDVNKWKILVRGPDGRLFEDECDVFINGGGEFGIFSSHRLFRLNPCTTS